jgi:hypothetical protein
VPQNLTDRTEGSVIVMVDPSGKQLMYKADAFLTEQLTDELAQVLLNKKIPLYVTRATTDEIIIPAYRKITKPMLRCMAYFFRDLEISLNPFRERIKYSGRRVRFIDSPEIQSWCKESRFGLTALEWSVIEGTVLAVVERDYRANPDKIMIREIYRQLGESEDPDQLLKEWERAMRDGDRENLPRISLARLGRDILGEILRQLSESKNPKQLLTKRARALVDGRIDDLPRIR